MKSNNNSKNQSKSKMMTILEQVQTYLPQREDENWRFTNLTPFFTENHEISLSEKSTKDYSKEKIEEIKKVINDYKIDGDDPQSLFVFINGHYSPLFSSNINTDKNENEKIKLFSIAHLLEKKDQEHYYFSDLCSKLLQERSDFSHDHFNELNRDFHQDGCFLYVKENVVIEQFVHFLHLTLDDREDHPALMINPRHLIYLEKGANVSLRETYFHFEHSPTFVNPVTDIYLSEYAQLNHYKMILEGRHDLHLGHTYVAVPSSALYQSYLFQWSGKIVRNTLRINLTGEMGSCNLYGLYAVKEGEQSDVYCFVNHQVPLAQSHQLYKGVLDGKSHGVFKGKVMVQKQAQKTSSQQLNKNLLLHNLAKIDSQPQLEIQADDVQCSHGATTNQLGQDEIFYLQSRGIPPEKIKKMLAHAFAYDVINKVPSASLRKHLETVFYENFEKMVSQVDPK